MENKDLGKTSTGIQANVEGLLCYVLGWVTGLIFYLLEKENKFVRFHAVQSMFLFGALSLVSTVLTSNAYTFGVFNHLILLLISGIGIFTMILVIILAIKAFQGEKFKIPIAGDFAEKISNNSQ